MTLVLAFFRCAITWRGPTCYCPPGSQADAEDPTRCVDLDECQREGACDQGCNNTQGSYTCHCVNGYHLMEDGTRCQAFNVPVSEKPSLIFANSADIQHVYFDGSPAYPLSAAKAAKLRDREVKAQESLTLDFLHRNRTLCWVSHARRKSLSSTSFAGSASAAWTGGLETSLLSHMTCGRIPVDSEEDPKYWDMPPLDLLSLHTVSQIAVDWASGNWYFLDDSREVILLCAHKDRQLLCKIILSVQLSKPRGLAVDPNSGLLFFTVWGTNTAKLERSELDG